MVSWKNLIAPLHRVLPMQDDLVAPFSLDNAPVRGRIARLGASVDAILRRHDYPWPVAMLLGEAITLAALVGSLLKVEGRLVVQAQGQGPVPLLVAEHQSGGGLRGCLLLLPVVVVNASADDDNGQRGQEKITS